MSEKSTNDAFWEIVDDPAARLIDTVASEPELQRAFLNTLNLSKADHNSWIKRYAFYRRTYTLCSRRHGLGEKDREAVEEALVGKIFEMEERP